MYRSRVISNAFYNCSSGCSNGPTQLQIKKVKRTKAVVIVTSLQAQFFTVYYNLETERSDYISRPQLSRTPFRGCRSCRHRAMGPRAHCWWRPHGLRTPKDSMQWRRRCWSTAHVGIWRQLIKKPVTDAEILLQRVYRIQNKEESCSVWRWLKEERSNRRKKEHVREGILLPGRFTQM